jgi:carbon monoxide dehydrogenase subunit G
MEIDETIHVQADPETVWSLLSDPRAVVECVEGATLGDRLEDGTYDAKMTVRFGPAKVAFGARVAIEMDHAARSGSVSSRGKDNQGGTRFAASTVFRVLVPDNGEGSAIRIQSQVEITGRLASLIESGAAIVIKRMTRDFSERLHARCMGAAASGTGDRAVAGAGAGTGDRAVAGAAAGPVAAARAPAPVSGE